MSDPDTCTSTLNCSSGEFRSGVGPSAVCDLCSNHLEFCTTCDSATQCTQCQSGTELKTGECCILKCVDCNVTTCSTCVAGYSSYNGYCCHNDCLTCDLGTPDTCTSTLNCPSGEFKSGSGASAVC